MAREITTLVPWFGTNRSCAACVGEQLDVCEWLGVPFVGGCCELRHVTARTINAADLHRHLINLANVLKDNQMGPALIRRLRRMPFHEDALRAAQTVCRSVEEGDEHVTPLCWAEAYFVAAWMGRNGIAGTGGEFRAGLSVRWDAGGGDSPTRFRSAVEALRDWRRTFRCCTFVVRDCFAFLADVKDRKGHGLYCDPPFPGPGDKYAHNPGKGEDARAWHARLRDTLEAFTHTRVVCRFYRHPLVEALYKAPRWRWLEIAGGKTQTNAPAPEVLLVNADPLPAAKKAA